LYNPVHAEHLCNARDGGDLNYWNAEFFDTGCDR